MRDGADIVILIPAYNPGDSFSGFVRDITALGFRVFIVNDGSDPACHRVFEEAGQSAVVLHHDHNKGKGAALKTGFRYLSEYVPDLKGVVTADADGQHSIRDICRIARRLQDLPDDSSRIVLGVRNLKSGIPWKSAVGNSLSRFVFAVVTGKYLSDNQTGLRGFSAGLLQWLAFTEGSRYEYEMQMLVQAQRKGIAIEELAAETIYEDGNSTSHFQPVRDTCRIQAGLILSGWRSILWYLFLFTAFGVLTVCRVNPLIGAASAAVAALLRTAAEKKNTAFSFLKILVSYGLVCLSQWITGSLVPGIVTGIAAVIALSYLMALMRKDESNFPVRAPEF